MSRLASSPVLATERLDGRECGGASDVYALAAVLYECLTGAVAFPGTTRAELVEAHRRAPRPRISRLRPDLAELDEVIATGMAIDPEDRYPSATAFTRAAAAVLGIEIIDDAPISDEAIDGPDMSPADPPPVGDVGATEVS
jgi:serine/threonine protein kinase